jgi:NitT/TauT family transport system substrate-binding protein
MKFIILMFSLFSIAVSAGQKVTMVLQWEHQSQFAGYYMALEKGFYTDEGLDVNILRGGADVDPFELLEEGDADFCSAMLAPVLMMSQDTNKFCLLAQIINCSTLSLVAWKDATDGSIISEPSDLDGKKVAIWESFRAPYKAMFDYYGVTPKILPQYYSFSLFSQRGVDACSAMMYNEYHSLLQLGVGEDEIVVFKFSELGMNFPEDGIYCLKGREKQDPELCSAFVRASMKGWEYSKEHPEETLDIVMKYIKRAKLPTNRPHMKWMLDTVLDTIYPSEDGKWTAGKLSEKSFNESKSILNITNELSYDSFTFKEVRDVQD